MKEQEFQGLLAYTVDTIEVGDRITMIFGIGKRIVSIVFGLIMVGAISPAKLPDRFLTSSVYDLV